MSKKRGRPAGPIQDYYTNIASQNDVMISERAFYNRAYAERAYLMLGELKRADLQSFFDTQTYENYKCKGVLEQLGRMLEAGLFKTGEQFIGQTEDCIKAYYQGMSSKEIERRLRQARLERVKHERDLESI